MKHKTNYQSKKVPRRQTTYEKLRRKHTVIMLCMILFFLIGILVTTYQLALLSGFFPPPKTVTMTASTQKDHALGEIFPMPIRIKGIKQAINVVNVVIAYDPKAIEVVDISTKDSFASLFVQKQIDNTVGISTFAGGLPNPGYSGSDGLFATIYLRGLKTGITSIRFLPSSRVLANNGKGDNVLHTFDTITYSINPRSLGTESPEEEIMRNTSSSGQMIFFDEK